MIYLFYIYVTVAALQTLNLLLCYWQHETFWSNLFTSTLAGILWPITLVGKLLN